MLGRTKSPREETRPPGRTNPVSPELLEAALWRRVAEIEKLLDRLRFQGLNVDQLLDQLYERDGRLRDLWERVNSDILERSAKGQVTLEEALSWMEILDAWADLVTKELRRLTGQTGDEGG